MAIARKRPRSDLEESQAECPFKVEHPNPNEKWKKPKKRGRHNGDELEPPQQSLKVSLQVSTLIPIGKFKGPSKTMDRHYLVTPHQKWMDMTKYNSFVLNGVKHYSKGFVFVANDSTIERQKNPGRPFQPTKKSDDDWVARILEIRATDEDHVYARIYWMYWPDELPAGTQDGKRRVQGRQSYHGINELIASNHMDIINVASVTASAAVNQWIEQNDEEIQSGLYWRQAIDVRTMELSSVELRCSCNRPENPDKTMVGCTNEHCKKWLHNDCLVHAALLNTYTRLGMDGPHTLRSVEEEVPEGKDGRQCPLSPSESIASQTAQQSIDVKPEEQNTIKLANIESNLPDMDVGDSTTNAVTANGGEPKKRGRPRKSEPGEPGTSKPYKGLFEAVIRNDLTPPVVEITDLRQDVEGGEKTWTEPIACLICNKVIH